VFTLRDGLPNSVDPGDEPEVVTTGGRRFEDPSTALVYWGNYLRGRSRAHEDDQDYSSPGQTASSTIDQS